ncbi:MAG TPA: RNA polymerase sigma factor ShbA [Intrasporangium sp.]|jgi:RNA polymerase sigma factor, sigma-70 family|uniref:RNA polymerase sigma factor ShbA n=1 Tax=Intrasporangium sp. TaxID=1925024 RepID=UPI002F9401A0
MEGVDTATSLRELVSRAAHDDVARDQLVRRVRDLALRYARVRLGRFGAEDLAQDVAQEVCMAVVAAVPTYEERGLPFEAFVYRIASHKLADVQRVEMRGATPVADLPDRVDEAPTPEEAAVVGDEVALALSLLQKLPEAQREILILRVAVGMSTEETADAIGMTPGAVRVAQHRALARLRAMLVQVEAGEVA